MSELIPKSNGVNKKYILQLGLAFVLLYAGIAALLKPNGWIGFVPSWVTHFGTSRILALHLHSVAEVVLGVWLLSNIKIKWAALVTALDIAAILVFAGLDASVFIVTFRDVGLLLMAIYLFVAS